MNKQNTKRALLMSALSLLLCVSMLVGSTFAWFTDSVTSAGNIIKSGTLDVEMYWAEGKDAVPADDAGWNDASTGAIFNYDLWEPGFTQVRHIKIANVGSLALKYQVSIRANGTVSDLADVIDVYYVDPAVQIADRAALANAPKLGTLTEVLAGLSESGYGELIAGAADTITLAFKMQETAGNEYQGKAIGTDFSVVVMATQLTSEEDSFGKDYDLGAPIVSGPVSRPTGAVTLEGKENVQVTLTEELAEKLPAEVTEVSLAVSAPIMDTDNKTITFQTVELVDQNGNVIDLEALNVDEAVVVRLPVQGQFAEGETIVVYHDGAYVATVTVENDMITYPVAHLCEITVTAMEAPTENDNVVEIANAAQLLVFAQNVNNGNSYAGKTVVLTKDIDLSNNVWTPIGISSAKAFAGTFDGQGHTIRNLQLKASTTGSKYGAGFFGNLLNKTTIKNVNFDSVTYTTRANCVGVVAGYLYGSGTFENIKVTNANIQSFAKVGGIIGLVADPGAHTVNLTNCSVEGTIGGGYNVGGLIGLVLQNVTVNLSNCATDVAFIMNDSGYDMIYAQNANGEWMWQYNNQWDYAAVAEQYCYYDAQENEYCMGTPADVTFTVTGPKQLENALKAGGEVILGKDIAMEAINIANPNFVLDGNGYTITQTGTNTYALIDTTGGSVTLKNVTFDGVNGGAVVRTVGAKFNATNVTVQNSNHTQQQGLFRLMGESTIEDCVFKNNICSMGISLNYDGANNDPQIVKNCVFENNTCNGTAVVYYVKGAGCTLTGNKFIGNTVNVTGGNNAATAYMGFTEGNVITNNLFQGNVVNVGTSKRVAGALMIGYAAQISGNAFIDNEVTGDNAKANDVCASVYYTDIDLSGNYWGGNAPVADDDYYQEYNNFSVIINDYLTVNPF